MVKKSDPASVGERIVLARQAKFPIQARFARLIGIEPTSLCRVEKGERGASKKLLAKIAEATNTSIEYLLTGEVWQETIGAAPLCPYKSFATWQKEAAPANLTETEKYLLATLRFQSEPMPFRYTNILEQLRSDDSPAIEKADENTSPTVGSTRK